MELAQILNALNRNRMLLAGATVLAIIAAVLVAGRGETTRGGTASAEVLVDARESTLGDLRHETLPLVARSSILARFLGAGGATEKVAEEAGVPADEITMIGPPLNIDGVPDAEAAEDATQRAEDAAHLVQVQQGDDLPLLTIFTRATSESEARSLADGTTAALDDFVTRYQDESGIPPERRVTIRALGTTLVTPFEEGPGPLPPLLAFLVVFGLACAGILAWTSIGPGRRATSSGRAVAPPLNGNGNGGLPHPLERAGSKATSQREP
jgi:hypothetical protein